MKNLHFHHPFVLAELSSMSSSFSCYLKSRLIHQAVQNPIQHRHTVDVSPWFRVGQYEILRCRSNGEKTLGKDSVMSMRSIRKLSVATAAKGSSSDEPLSSSSSTTERSAKKGTVLGAASLIVGTSIGSGILAIPQRTSPAGFMPSAISIVLCWAFLVIEALVLAEINIHLREKKKKDEDGRIKNSNNDDLEVISVRTMAEETLGEWGGNLAASTYLFLSYTSMVAYTSKSGELLSGIIGLPSSASGIIFTFLSALLISVGGTNITDRVNQWLTFSMIGLLLVIEVSALSFGGWSSATTTSNWEAIPQAIPVIIFSLVFHDIVPVICAYLGGDIIRVRTSILLGSLVPLLSLLIWDYIALSLHPQLDGIDTLDLLSRGRWSNMLPVVDVFSILAVGTSLIGTLLGFSQFFLEQLVNLSNPSPLKGTSKVDFADSAAEDNQENWWERNMLTFVATSMAVVPSMIVSAIVPDPFSAATDIAGGYCMTILYGVLPPLMAWALHRSIPAAEIRPHSKGNDNEAMFSTVKPILIGVGLFSCGIVMDQVYQDLILLRLL